MRFGILLRPSAPEASEIVEAVPVEAQCPRGLRNRIDFNTYGFRNAYILTSRLKKVIEIHAIIKPWGSICMHLLGVNMHASLSIEC